MFLREIEVTVGQTVKSVRLDQQYEGDTGVVVWDAAIVLSKYLELISDQLEAATCLELGAGTGAVGLCAAALGCHQVVLTDRADYVDLLDHNIRLNQEILPSSQVSALPLNWGNLEEIKEVLKSCKHQDGGEGRVDFVLVSDCVFYKESIEDLVETLYLLSSDATQILLAYEERDSEIKLEVMKMFFEQMKSRFIWRKIPHSEHHQDFESPDIQIFNFTLSK